MLYRPKVRSQLQEENAIKGAQTRKGQKFKMKEHRCKCSSSQICIGIAIENPDACKLKIAKFHEIDKTLINTSHEDITTDRWLFNPGMYGKHVKFINQTLHAWILEEIDQPERLNELVGPWAAPGQTYKIMDFKDGKVPKEIKKVVQKKKLNALKAQLDEMDVVLEQD